jgi:hypothetical protein
MKNRLLGRVLLFAGIALAWMVAPAQAGSFTYVTPTGSSTGGGPVNAEADFTTGAGSMTITLKNLQANITDVAQALSDLQFTLSGTSPLTGSSETASSGQEINIASGGTFTLGSTVAAGWPYSSTATVGTLNVLAAGGAGPAHLIVGPPDGGNLYSAANGSIAGNGPHNPFLNQSASFTITGANITAATNVTAVTFSFGTTSGINVDGVPGVPEPSSLVLSILGVGSLGSIGLYRSRFRRRRLL